MRLVASVVSISFLACATSDAFAQDATSSPTATTTPAAPANANAKPVDADKPASNGKPAEDEDKTRFRWGLSGFGGPLVGPLSGGAGGLDARFGAQINHLVGVYGQPVLLLGAGADSSVNGASASGVALYGVGALVDVTLANIIYIAAGPELLHGGMGSSSVALTGSKAAGSTGPYFSVAGRAGLLLGSMKPERRKAFHIGLDFRMVMNPGDPLVLPMLALGYEAF